MDKIRLFYPEKLEENKELKITDEDFHYLANVMRCEIGSQINLFNENDGEYECKIINKNKKNLELKVLNRKEHKEITNFFDLAFCPPKSHKLDTLIQKCTELGVNSFIPIISDHTVNRKINIDRLTKIAKEAIEQSNQIRIPEIQEPISFSDFFEKSSDNQIFFADINTSNKIKDLKIEKKINSKILIGPEGDFSVKEIKQIKSMKNCISFSLGEKILRSETAAIAALTLFNNLID
ncbi:MAG: RsmE family RNA methyltransferase [Pelagibacteraceae bacterium]